MLGEYQGAVQWRLGYVARTCSGTTTICGGYRITGERLWIPVNEDAYKTGARTGTTSGRVTEGCVTRVIGTTTYLCQYVVNARVGTGDSGSAVFSIASGSDVNFAGQLHAGLVNSSTGIGDYYYFSPLNNIQAIHGNIITTYHGSY